MKKYILTFFVVFLSSITTFANEIICYNAGSQELAMMFSSRDPIPDYSFEKFKYHSSSGSIFVHGKDLGTQWLSVKDSGLYLDYEINIQSAFRRPIAYVHLSLDKSGNFNGYQQFNNDLSGQLKIEQLNCRFVLTSNKMAHLTTALMVGEDFGVTRVNAQSAVPSNDGDL